MARFLLVLGIAALIVMFLRSVMKRQKTAVLVSARGVALRGWGAASDLDWDAVCRIDLERMPSQNMVFFCVVLIGTNGRSLAVYRDFFGFERFRQEMFSRWPAIAAEWQRMAAGPADISERVTAWKKG